LRNFSAQNLKDQQGFSCATLIVYYDQRAESIKTKRKRSAYFRTCHRPVLILVPIRFAFSLPWQPVSQGWMSFCVCVGVLPLLAVRIECIQGGARPQE